MVAVAGHLSLEGLELGYRSAEDGTKARHFEVIRLLAKGYSTADVSELTGFGIRWIEELVVCYNTHGPDRPSASIARQSQNFFPPIVMTASSICHLSFGFGRFLRMQSAQ